ncbi:Uncharacterized protein BP5553_05777 [Venustampulla echinocandica]|uniref:chitinase n=1 Tax=Venustampulla echinocandica TaxID=2656787 RepID=A0A370TLM8_9HELO|nr:Uncharacterized protein BP5553_05777 [Venustampulla echinocandica]RDL36425.1 Uncharacterized protein BP5553_05777 [Venustampulla echinocandica]
MRFSTLLFAASVLVAPTVAQTWTDCNPLNATCPDNPALGMHHNFVFNKSSTVTNSFNITAGKLEYGNNGAEFTINKRKDSPTIQSKFYIFFGSVSVVMKAATGQGIISSIVLQSEDLDEVDWEFMGGNATHAETNYFGKGNTTSFDRAVYYPVDTDVRENFHNYTVDWTAERLIWMIDGKIVRTLPFAEANKGHNYPQTPVTVRLGIWSGGDTSFPQGTIDWAGGLTDFSKGPYTMYVKSADVKDYSTGSAYHWGDRSGSWQSIKALAGNSTAAEKILKAEEPTLSIAEKFQALPQTTKMGIYIGSGSAAALLLAAFLFVCIRQRRAGRKERDAYNAKVEKERQDAYTYQVELREKGMGGWDNREFANQGDDALGGWGGSHVVAGSSTRARGNDVPTLPEISGNTGANDFPLRSPNPASGYAGSNNIPRSPSFAHNGEIQSTGSTRGGYHKF